MGSHLQAWLTANSADEAQILSQLPIWFEEWEAVLSRFRPTSELSRLNAHAGEWVTVSPALFQNIADARDAAEMTRGVFNPLILNALEAAGYDRSFEPGMTAAHHDLVVSQPVASAQAIELDEANQAVYLPAGARIDLGGIAKGWAAQQTADRLAEIGPCLVDAGGDLVAYGSPDDSGGWGAHVQTPDGAQTLYTLLLADQAMATSGTDYRRWERGGQTMHHLVDPYTGRPAESPIVQATVIAPDATLAVVWAKVGLMTRTFPDFPAVFVYHDGTVLSNLEVV
jgi:FAD:protein FMN transferase